MKLKILLPNERLLDRDVTKVTAEAENGHFCLLPRHVDFVAALVPGLLSFEDENGDEHFLAIDDGMLVKCGQDVLVAARDGVHKASLGELRRVVDQEFEIRDERERLARSAAARLEAGLVRRFVEFDKRP